MTEDINHDRDYIPYSNFVISLSISLEIFFSSDRFISKQRYRYGINISNHEEQRTVSGLVTSVPELQVGLNVQYIDYLGPNVKVI